MQADMDAPLRMSSSRAEHLAFEQFSRITHRLSGHPNTEGEL